MQLFAVIPQPLGILNSPTFAGLNIFGTSTPTLTIESSDASDPTLIFKTTNTANQLNLYLDESQAEDFLRIEGQTASQDTIISIRAQDGENAELQLKSGALASIFKMSSNDNLSIKNTVQDKDLIFGIKDGAVFKTITWDADVDRLKHNAGLFHFDDDNITTLGRGTFTDFTVPGNSVFGLNSSVFQPATDSTTFFQVLDADGGTPVFNVDTTNERIGIGTAIAERKVHIITNESDVGIVRLQNLATDGYANFDIEDENGNLALQFGYGGSTVSVGALRNAGNLSTIGADPLIFRTNAVERMRITSDGKISINRISSPFGQVQIQSPTTGATTGIALTETGSTSCRSWIDSSDNWLMTRGATPTIGIAIASDGKIGIGEDAPETLTEWTSTVPYLTLHNSTHEDSDGGRESRLNFKGEQSGGEETTLARIEIGHDGASDDQLGKEVHSVNTGAGLVTTMTLDSKLAAIFTKIKLTELGGYAIKMTNQTDAVSVAGKVVECDHGANDAVELSEANGDHLMGVFLDSGIANGSEVWIVIAGVADVLYEDTESSARGNWVYQSGTAGFAIDAIPTPGHAADHWKEIGHCCETVTYVDTPILARCVLHFN